MRTKCLLTALLLFSLVAAMGCGGAVTPEDPSAGARGTVSGTVVEEGNDRAVAGATVVLGTSAEAKTATTDDTGAFTISEVLYGTYTINASYSPPGTSLSGSAQVVVSDSAQNPTVTIEVSGTTGPPPPPF